MKDINKELLNVVRFHGLIPGESSRVTDQATTIEENEKIHNLY